MEVFLAGKGGGASTSGGINGEGVACGGNGGAGGLSGKGKAIPDPCKCLGIGGGEEKWGGKGGGSPVGGGISLDFGLFLLLFTIWAYSSVGWTTGLRLAYNETGLGGLDMGLCLGGLGGKGGGTGFIDKSIRLIGDFGLFSDFGGWGLKGSKVKGALSNS